MKFSNERARRYRNAAGALMCGVLSLWGVQAALAEDWTQWRGPKRDGVSKETGLLKSWGQEGPALLWKAEGLGEGHATPSVADGRIYGMGLLGEEEFVWAVDAKTGKIQWKTKIDGVTELGGRQGGFGPRATPTVDGSRLYTLGVGGMLVALNRADGRILWQKSLVESFGGNVPTWGYSESPLVDGDKVIATPGGGQSIVAFNKNTGATVWVSKVPDGNGVHYSSAVTANFGGRKQYVQFLAGGVVGVAADSGQLLWRYNAPANRVANCSTPIILGNQVFAASGYQTGGGLATISAENSDKMTAQEVYFTRDMMNHHGGMVAVGDYLYGFDDRNRSLTCLELKTGKVMWQDKSVGKGSVTYADGHIYLRSERGPVALVEAKPTGYVEKGRFEQPDRSNAPSWPYPVVSNGMLLLRDQGVLLCYNVRAK